MSQVASVILPLFGLILIGFWVGKRKLIAAGGAAALEFFVFYLALPSLFFRMIAATPLNGIAIGSFVLTTTFATYCAFAIAFSFGALINRGKIPEATVLGLAGSHANLSYMAPALTISLFGMAAAAPTALIFTFDHALTSLLVPLMMALGGTQRVDAGAVLISIVRRVLLHPVVIATIAGLLFAIIGIGLPGPIDSVLGILGGGAAPAALFAFGLGLSHRPIKRAGFDVAAIVFAKLVIHPLIVYLLLGWIGGFERIWINTAMLLAALPPAVNVLTIARRYETYTDRASLAILYGTAISLVTVTVVLTLVVANALPLDPFH
jgi:predicted permease